MSATGKSSIATTAPTGASADQVQGTAAVGAAPVGNPVFVAGTNKNTGNLIAWRLDGSGNTIAVGNDAIGAGLSVNPLPVAMLDSSSNVIMTRTAATTNDAGNGNTELSVGCRVFDGTAAWQRARSMTIGDNAAATGITAVGLMLFDGATFDRARADSATSGALMIGGQGIAGTPAGGVVSVQGVSGGTAVPVSSAVPAAANILDGVARFVATTAATTVITIPANRTWVGNVTVECIVTNSPTVTTGAVMTGVVSVAGAGVTPPAGTVFEIDAQIAANAATGATGTSGHAVGSQRLVVIAPVGNAVTVQFAATQTNGTNVVANCSVVGELQ